MSEEALLGSILINPDVLWSVRDVLSGSQSFQIARHGIIYDAMCSIPAIDFTLLCRELENRDRLKEVGGAAYLTQLVQAVPTAMHAEHYAHLVENAYQLRRLTGAAGRIAQVAHEVNDAKEAHARSLEVLHGIAPKQVGYGVRPLNDIVDENIARLQGMMDGDPEAMGLNPGFSDLNRAWGGLQRGKLIIIGGRPGMAKSSLCENIAHSVCNSGKNVVFFSAEMSSEELMTRMACRVARVDSTALKSGDVSDSEKARVWGAVSDIQKLPLWVDDQASITTSEMRLRLAQFRYPVDLVLVDYIQRLGDKGDSEVLRVERIAQALKNIARTLDVPVIAISQLSRAVEHRSPPIPTLSDLRSSGGLEQESDLVVFLYRNDYYVELGLADDIPLHRNICCINTAKNRSGRTRMDYLRFDPTYTLFQDLDKETLERLRQA